MDGASIISMWSVKEVQAHADEASSIILFTLVNELMTEPHKALWQMPTGMQFIGVLYGVARRQSRAKHKCIFQGLLTVNADLFQLQLNF